MESSAGLRFDVVAHPRASGSSLTLLCTAAGALEVTAVSPPGRKYGSYISGGCEALSDGRLYVGTPYDGLLSALEHLQVAAGRYAPLDQVLEGLPEAVKEGARGRLATVCEVSDRLGEDCLVYKYSEEKVLAWLGRKVGRVAKVLRKHRDEDMKGGVGGFAKGFNAGAAEEGGSVVGGAVDDDDDASSAASSLGAGKENLAGVARLVSQSESSVDGGEVDASSVVDAQIDRTALLFVCEYLADPELARALARRVGVSESVLDEKKKAAVKRKAAWENDDVEQDRLLEYTMGGGGAVTKGDAEPVKITDKNGARAAKKLSKVSTKGMKSLSSFFGGAKPKKK